MAIKVIQEVVIDISHQKSKNISEISLLDKINIIITLCRDASENCPVFPGKVERIHWAIEDPLPLPKRREAIKKLL